jgi:hypothetical protein
MQVTVTTGLILLAATVAKNSVGAQWPAQELIQHCDSDAGRVPTPTSSLFGWLVADGWCWFVLREEYCWLVAAGCWWLVRYERKVLLAGG